MYEAEPSEHELEAAGLTLEDVATSVEIWPDNVRAFNLFQSLRTQWYVGMGGAYGLNFLVAYARMDRMCLTAEEYNQMDVDLQVMEAAALQVMYEEAEKRSGQGK